MLSMEEIGYFSYMQECERKAEQKRKESAAVGKYQVEVEQHLEGESTTKGNKTKWF